MGARPLPTTQWVSTPDDDWAPTIAMKRSLLKERPDEVAAALVGYDDACEEAARGVLESVGVSTSGRGLSALVTAATHVADDLCIMADDGHGRPRLVAAVLCSPNRWRLSDKLGSTMWGIHRPVARYDTDLASPVDAVMARLSESRPLWRVNWGVTNHPALFQPVTPPPTPDIDPSQLWIRVEWQTLRRLGRSGAILFTIRTFTERMDDFVGREIRVVHDLADLIAKIPDDVAEYKSIAMYRARLFDYLERR